MKRTPSVLVRVLMSNAALGSLTVVVLVILLMAAVRQSFRAQLDLRAAEMAEFLAAQSQYPLLVADRAALGQLVASALHAEDVLSVTIADNSGGEPVEGMHAGSRAAEHAIQVARTVAAPRDGMFGFEAVSAKQATLGTILVAISTAKQDALFRNILWYAAGLTVLVLAIAIPLQFLDLRRVLSPLAELSRFAGRVGAGDLSERAPIIRSDEIGDLTLAFNRMLDHLSSTTVSRDYVDNIIRCMAESLIVVDTKGAIRMVNQATVDLLGCNEAKLLGKSATVICGIATPGGGMQETVMDVYRDYEGREIPVLFSRAPLRGMNGAISGEVWMAQDMTERQRAQEELVVAKDAAENANRAKSLFLTTMSHELRTPLNAILGFAQLLRIEMEDAGMDRWDGDLDKIERAGQHLLGLINNILDLSKIDAGHMELMLESTDVAELVRSATTTAEPLAAKNRNRISVSTMPATLMIDPMRVQQCLLNLIGNACKFTQEGEIAVEGVAESGWYRVSVRDSGIGIESEDIARLFGDFAQVDASTTRKYGGTGLGLAISRRFARLMGGDITVESMPGHGSTFTLHLPSVPAQMEASSEHGTEPELVGVGG